ncbi:MAG: YceI family protein [Chryseolinea sp.]
MKRILIALVLILSTAVVGFGQTWSLDKAHAKLGFGVTHLLVSSVEGSFKTFDAKITSSKDDFSDAIVELTADASSVYTDNEKRDEHLRSVDFFDVTKYPTLSFKSTSFKKVADKKYKAIGDLTLHGITKPVELEVTLNGTAVHPYTKKTIAGFKVAGTLKRSDFDLGKGTPNGIVSDEVALNTNAEFVKE